MPPPPTRFAAPVPASHASISTASVQDSVSSNSTPSTKGTVYAKTQNKIRSMSECLKMSNYKSPVP